MNVALTGVILDIVGYKGAFDPDVVKPNATSRLSGHILYGYDACGHVRAGLAMILYFFYKLDNRNPQGDGGENLRRRLDAAKRPKPKRVKY